MVIANIIVTGLGILGVLLITASFILEALNKLPKNHHMYSILNVAGSILLLVYSYFFNVMLFIALNLVTTVVGLYGLYRVYYEK